MKRRIALVFVLLAVALVISLILTVSIGSVRISANVAYKILKANLFSGNMGSIIESTEWTKSQFHIVWNIRAPRVLMGVFAGAGLAVSGAVMQALTLNPIADPFILGVSSGGSAGAALALLTTISFFGGYGEVTIMSFLGASLASLMVYGMSRLGNSSRIQPVALLLSGAAVNAVMSAITNILIFLAKSPESIAAVYYWQMGSIASAQWKTLTLPAVAVAGSVLWFSLNGSRFNLLMMGDEDAIALGLNVNRFRTLMMLTVAFVIGSLVSVTGVIGFIGLMVPHLVRMALGVTDNRVVIPGCALFGAFYMIWADTGARGLLGATEIPLGIITAFAGAPFFIFLLLRQRMTGKGDLR
ncbi:MAG: iron ABC transporter permease [Treponema sp.]|jgi:iron complex transport system permease protein|nr:iron ABC transporter permease [Treponema sp.]